MCTGCSRGRVQRTFEPVFCGNSGQEHPPQQPLTPQSVLLASAAESCPSGRRCVIRNHVYREVPRVRIPCSPPRSLTYKLTTAEAPAQKAEAEAYRKADSAWRGDRVVEGARLEIVCTERYRGFESLPLRQFMVLPTSARETRQARKGATVAVTDVWRGHFLRYICLVAGQEALLSDRANHASFDRPHPARHGH